MREPLLGCAVGKKGIGKTYTTVYDQITPYILGNSSKGVHPRKVLILDVNNEYTHYRAIRIEDVPLFSIHQIVEVRRILPFKPNGGKMTLNEIASCLTFVLDNFKCGLLLIEDINRYVSDSLPNDLVGAICTQRHAELDIIMHFQAIGRITPKIWQNINFLRFHKNTESVDAHRKKFEDKYEMFKLTEMMVDDKYYNGDKYFYCYVDLDTEKIHGAYDNKMMDKAINAFIGIAPNHTIKPFTKMKDRKGNALYSYEQAYQMSYDRIYKKYFKL